MNTSELTQQLENLKQQIHFHNYRYHVLDDPVISDSEFDQLMAELREIENTHPDLITPDSPTQRIGGRVSERFTKVDHPAPILSLGNAFNEDDIRSWYQRLYKIDERMKNADFVVEPKIDGLTVVLHYRNGIFIQGATRGDGDVGEDVTQNLRTIQSLPLVIPIDPNGVQPPPYLVVRGEVFMNCTDFEQLNKRLAEDGEKTYQNPRNTAAGSLRQLDSALTASRPLRLLCYAIVFNEGEIPETQMDVLDFLRNLGFPVTIYTKLCKNIDEVVSYCESWIVKRFDLPFEIDGMVIKVNDHSLAADLGFVGKDPRGALAYKFPAEEVTTKLIDIGINVGRTGVLTPYAILNPIRIGGVIVKQATLHNFDYISEKDIRIGDSVLVKRAGDVIPYVIGPVVSLRTGKESIFIPPSTCPICGERVENLPGEVAWYCVNASCPEQLIRNVEHFVSRGAMDIVGLGINIVKQLVETGLIKDVADLYSLKKENLLRLDGFADKKADNLLLSIANSKDQSLSRLINALGIRGVGEVMATDLVQHYRDLDELAHASATELESIEGIGPNISGAIIDWFARPSNLQVLQKLRSSGIWPTTEINLISDEILHTKPFFNKTFVITGTLPSMTRNDMKSFILENGGKVTSSISKQTNYLVVGENPGSKLSKAQSLGVILINEAELLQMAGKSDENRS